jgi:K+-sensing histidine kinase KdpD
MYPSMVRDHIDEKELNLKDSLRFSYHKFWSLLGAYLLAGLAIIAAALLIGVPLGLLFSRTNSPVVMLGVIIAAAIAAVLVAAIFCYTCPAIIMEDVRAMQGLERSIEIARENYSFTLSIFLIAAVITCAIDGIFVGLPIFLGVEYYTPILLSILYFPIALLITTWMAIIFPYAYHEIRT